MVKKIFSYLGLILPLSLLIAGGLWYSMGPPTNTSETALAPIPDFLMLSKNSQVTLLDLWSPVIKQIHGSEGAIDNMTAQSALMYDLTTNKPLFEKETNVRRPMASLTKIMTAIVALEHPKDNDKYIVHGADLVGEDSMGLASGEMLSRDELLYGLMLPSGNDAAEVIASNYPAGRAAFIQAMNDKAKALGLKDTKFSNPSGLQGDGTQYTTTYDLLVMTRYAIEHFPLFAKIISTPTYELPPSDTHKGFSLVNETNLLTSYKGVQGVKTGYTPEAGLCLVTYIDYGGHKMIGVILKSENRRGEMKELLDFSLKAVGVEPPKFEEAI